MDAKQAYKAAYRMWRIFKRFQTQAGKYSPDLFNEAKTAIMAACGSKACWAASGSTTANRDVLLNENSKAWRRERWTDKERRQEVKEDIKFYFANHFPASLKAKMWPTVQYERVAYQPVAPETFIVTILPDHQAKRYLKRGLVKCTVMERYYRRRQNLTEWQLTEAGREMLGDDQDDQDLPGGDDFGPADKPYSPSPSGIIFAEMAY